MKQKTIFDIMTTVAQFWVDGDVAPIEQLLDDADAVYGGWEDAADRNRQVPFTDKIEVTKGASVVVDKTMGSLMLGVGHVIIDGVMSHVQFYFSFDGQGNITSVEI